MEADLGGIIGEGFRIWQRNLSLAVPFILAAAFTTLSMLPLLAAFVGALGSVEDIEALETASPYEVMAVLRGSTELIAAGLALSLALMLLSASFFAAGGIAMSLEAVETGTTRIRTMISGGRRHIAGMLVLSVLLALITLAGAAFLLPGAASILSGAASVPWTDIEAISDHPEAMALIAAGMLLFILWALVVSIILALSPYALVVEAARPVEAIRRSIMVFRRSPLDVFILWVIVVALSISISAIGGAVAPESGPLQASFSMISALVSVAILEPLAAVWWTLLYLRRTGRREKSRGGDAGLWD